MKISDYILRAFRRGTNKISEHYGQFFSGDWNIGRLPFGRFAFVSISELLTDLANDVTFQYVSGEKDDFYSFNAFFNYNGQFVLNRLLLDGYVVIGKSNMGLEVLAENQFTKRGDGKDLYAEPNDRTKYTECYVIKSATYQTQGMSDFAFCNPFVKYLDNALNASNTTLERLGAFVVASPKSATNLPTPITLTKNQKEDLEKEIQSEYGALSSQKSIMVLPREMDFNIISLAQLDTRTNDRVRVAILAICDKLRVPANQVAIIDATSSKSLSNGSELREGDFNKYQSFERLLNKTFVRMAQDMGLNVDYSIYNKPKREKTTII